MYLVFYVFNCHKNLESVFAKIKLTNDIGLLEDSVNKSSEQIWFELVQIDSGLATGADFIANLGEDQIVNELSQFITNNPAKFSAFSKIFLHWVDNSEIKWIKNAQSTQESRH